jgi:antibiotic biosynthesis monooxygenase (ABM) superfamily enzyme
MSEPVTVVVARTVKKGHEASYEAWLQRTIAAARRFEGHQGADVVRTGGRFILLFRFDDLAHLLAWESSLERAALVREVAPITEDVSVARSTGLETWFTVDGTHAFIPPPRWKMALVSWLVAFPLIQILNATLGPLLGAVPTLLRGAIVGAAMILTMTYVAMPLVTRALARFLR